VRSTARPAATASSTSAETCDDGNTLQGCIKNDSFPADACRNDCTNQICRDPTKAVIVAAMDKFTFHGQLTTTTLVDFAAENFAVELTSPTGHVIYRTSLGAGAVLNIRNLAAGPFKYTNKLAKVKGGLAKLKIRRVGDAYRATVQGYGNLLGVQSDMLTRVHAGATKWTVDGDWERRSDKLWKFHPAVD
jgi:hypothetical protein